MTQTTLAMNGNATTTIHARVAAGERISIDEAGRIGWTMSQWCQHEFDVDKMEANLQSARESKLLWALGITAAIALLLTFALGYALDPAAIYQRP